MNRSNVATVTAVIPAYNAEKFLERTILSAAGQTHDDLKILVVDDGSTDGTAELVKRLMHSLPQLSSIRTQNRGVAAARNLGTELADSEYVAFLDSDDLWHPTKIAKQINAIQRHGSDSDWAACYTLFRRIDEQDFVVRTGSSYAARGAIFGSHLVNNHVGNGSSLLVKRDAAIEIGGFDPSYADRGIGGCEDLDFQLRLLRKYRLEVVPEFLVGYRYHSESMSANHKRMGFGHVEVINKYLDDPTIGPTLHVMAKEAMNRFLFMKLLAAKDWKNSFLTLLKLLRLAPVQTLSRLNARINQSLITTAKHSMWGILNVRDPDRRLFYDWQVSEGFVAEEKLPHSPVIRQLRRLDDQAARSREQQNTDNSEFEIRNRNQAS